MKKINILYSLISCITISAIIVFSGFQCSSPKRAAWLGKLNKSDTRFQINVFGFKEISSEQNIKLTKKFAELWKRKSGFEVFVQNKEIIMKILKSGMLVPSTNYIIRNKIFKLADTLILNFQIINKETGEVIVSYRIKSKNIEEITGNFEKAVNALLSE